MKDLLQTPELIPDNIKSILDSFDEDADSYKECERLKEEINAEGYQVEYDLSGQLYNLWQAR